MKAASSEASKDIRRDPSVSSWIVERSGCAAARWVDLRFGAAEREDDEDSARLDFLVDCRGPIGLDLSEPSVGAYAYA